MKKISGTVLIVLGILTIIVAEAWCWYISMLIIYAELGFLGFVLATVLFPAVVVITPFYAGLVHGYWFPLILAYGGGFTGFILFAIGDYLGESSRLRKRAL